MKMIGVIIDEIGKYFSFHVTEIGAYLRGRVSLNYYSVTSLMYSFSPEKISHPESSGSVWSAVGEARRDRRISEYNNARNKAANQNI